MILDATNKSVTVVLGEAKTTSDCDITVAFEDITTTTYLAGASDGVTNGVTPATLVAAPAASTQRRVRELTLVNNDTISHTVTVGYVDGANTRQLWKGPVGVGGLLQYANGVWNSAPRQTLLSTDISDSTTIGRGLLTAASDVIARPLVYAAPFDALAYNNILINGSMEVDQEHVGAPSTVGVGSGYAIDGWAASKSGTMVCTMQQVADAPAGFTNSLKLTVGTAEVSIAAGDYTIIYQKIEGYRSSRLGWGAAGAQSITLAFWTKIHRTGVYSGCVQNAAHTRSFPFTFVQNIADTWEYKTVTIPGDAVGAWVGNTNTASLYVIFTVVIGSTFAGTANTWAATNYIGVTGSINGVAATSDTFQITGVIVLPGIELPSAARAPLIMRPFTQELTLCQRYFEIIGPQTHIFSGDTTSGQQYYRGSPFSVTKRAAPTVSGVSLSGYGFANTVGTFSSEVGGFAEGRIATATQVASYFQTTVTADARL